MTKKKTRPFEGTTKIIRALEILEQPIPASIAEIGRPVRGSAPVSEPTKHEANPPPAKEQSRNIPVSIVGEDEQVGASEE